MKINEKFKLIRIQRKLSLKSLSNISGSIASISDFENGKSNLNNEVLLKLLGYMIIELDEFFDKDEIINKDFWRYIKIINQAIENNNLVKLHQIKKQLNQEYLKTNFYVYNISSILLSITIYKLKKETNKINPLLLRKLNDYFFSLEYWSNMDIVFLSISQDVLPINSIINYSDKILAITPIKIENKLDAIKINCLINIMSNLIKQNEEKATGKLITALSTKNIANDFIYQKIRFMFYQNVYNYLWSDNKQLALLQQQELVNAYKIIFDEEKAKFLDDLFSEYTNK